MVTKMVSIPVIGKKEPYHDNIISNKCSHEWDLNPYNRYISSCDIKKCIHCGVRKTIFIPGYQINSILDAVLNRKYTKQ